MSTGRKVVSPLQRLPGLILVGAFLTAILLAEVWGAPLSFVLDAPVSRQEEARLIASQLAEIGIDAGVRIHEPTSLREMARKGLGQAYLTDWGSSFFDPFDLAVPKLSTGGRENFSFYSNPRVDRLLKTAGSSVDEGERARAYHQVQEIIYRQTPWAFGFVAPRFEAVAAAVQDYSPALDGRISLHDVRLTDGDTLVVALDTDAFISLDPAAYRGRETETVIRNLFDGLVTRKPDGKVVPELAESWTQPNACTYVFKLRHGPRFHNGDPVTADDVVFTFERILNPFGVHGSPSPRRDLLGPLERVEVAGTDEVRFTLATPFPMFLQALVHFQIVNKSHLQRYGDRAFSRPVGTGPFQYAGGTLATEIVMERFDAYYGGSPELPPAAPSTLEKVIFRPIPDDQKRAELLIRGVVHIVQGVMPRGIERLETHPGIRVLAVEGTRSYQLELNNGRPPFNDIRVRKAVSLAIDWPAILKEVYRGFGRTLATCFLPNGFGFQSSLSPPARNPELARRLLESAGYDVL